MVRDACRKEGVLLSQGGAVGNVVRFQPPMIMNKEEIDHAISVLSESLAEVENCTMRR